jgi:hypothetical protein
LINTAATISNNDLTNTTANLPVAVISQEQFQNSVIQQFTLISQQITSLAQQTSALTERVSSIEERVSSIEIATSERSNKSNFFLNILKYFHEGLKKQTTSFIWKKVLELIIIPICSLLLGAIWFSLGNFITNPRKDHIVEMKTKKNVPTINSCLDR